MTPPHLSRSKAERAPELKSERLDIKLLRGCEDEVGRNSNETDAAVTVRSLSKTRDAKRRRDRNDEVAFRKDAEQRRSRAIGWVT